MRKLAQELHASVGDLCLSKAFYEKAADENRFLMDFFLASRALEDTFAGS